MANAISAIKKIAANLDTASTAIGIGTTPINFNNYLYTNQVFTNNLNLSGSLKEKRIDLSSGTSIDLNAGNYFSKTVSASTTFTVTNVAATGVVNSFILDLTNGGSATVTWWSGMKWASGTAPSLTSAGRDILGFFTYDAGATWNGLVLAKDIK